MKIKSLHPLISCICITQNRADMLLKSVLSFDQQNYPNKELVISYSQDDEETILIINNLLLISKIRILAIERSCGESIGKARNDAISKCNGDYICMWDDDDIFYFTRLADQYNLLQGNGRYFQSSIITQVTLFDSTTNKAYISIPYNWTGTLLCKKEYILKYPCKDSNQFECAPVIDFLESKKLILRDLLHPSLYVYVYHGSNVIDYFHFQLFIRKSQPLNKKYAQSIHDYLEQKLKIFMS